MHIVFIIPTTLICVVFGPTISIYIINYLFVLYLFVLNFLSSIATESEWCSPNVIFGTRLCTDVDKSLLLKK